MQLQTKSFSALLQDMAASTQGALGATLDFTAGSVLRALYEAVAGVFLWLQYSALQILSVTRAATSTGADLDSWMADFSFSRLPASAAAGSLTFGRFTSGAAVVIPVGTLAKSADGLLVFTVVADTANPAWNAAGYFTLGAGVAQVTVAACAVAPGSAGNVAAGSVTLLASPLTGVDTVVNTAAFAGGMDAESDVALRNRFVFFINSRSLATRAAILFSVLSVQQGLQVAVLENVSAAGGIMPGNFLLAVGTANGVLTPVLMAQVAQAVEAVRPVGTTYSIMAPVVVSVTVSFELVMTTGVAASSVMPAVAADLSAWIAAVPIGGVVSVSKMEALVHASSNLIMSVRNMQVNGSGLDIQGNWNEIFTVAAITGA